MKTKNFKFETSRICTACQQIRRKEALLFDPNTLKPYCANIQICNSSNPNSYAQVLDRGGKMAEMVTFKQAEMLYRERLINNSDPVTVEVLKTMTTPTSVRVTDFDLAGHLVKVRTDRRLPHITAAINEIIRDHKQFYLGNLVPKNPDEAEPQASDKLALAPEPKVEPPVETTEQNLNDF